ncbi:MAG: hypothetical protein LBR57_04170 [Alistipes sp.]|jgi:hypothetical protein|nr:hypothetical protein [Alistipes sp.]
MKKLFPHLACVALIASLALMTSCGLVEKASERDVKINDFSFSIDTSAITAGPEDSRAGATTRADGSTRYSGNATIVRDKMLGGMSFDYDMIKNATVGGVKIEVDDKLAGIVVENLSVSCPGVPSVEMKDVPLDNIGQAEEDKLKVFASGLFMAAINNSEVTVSMDATFSEPITETTVRYTISLSGIVIRAGLDL